MRIMPKIHASQHLLKGLKMELDLLSAVQTCGYSELVKRLKYEKELTCGGLE